MAVKYLDAHGAAAYLGISLSSVKRHAKVNGLGICVPGTAGPRLVALSRKDLERLRGIVQPGPGNPNWIKKGKRK